MTQYKVESSSKLSNAIQSIVIVPHYFYVYLVPKKPGAVLKAFSAVYIRSRQVRQQYADIS